MIDIVVCPECRRRLLKPDDVAALKVQCVCGHVFGSDSEAIQAGPPLTAPPALPSVDELDVSRRILRLKPVARHHGIPILVLACASVMFSFCPAIGWLLAIGVLIAAGTELQRMQRGKVDPAGEPLVRAARLGAAAALGLGLIFLILSGRFRG
jgi:hypothetical protein